MYLSFLQERAAGALANLAADDKCSMVVAAVGGVHALVKLACSCEYEGVQEQVELPNDFEKKVIYRSFSTLCFTVHIIKSHFQELKVIYFPS